MADLTIDDDGVRRRASTGSPWEPVMGYARAVRQGNVVAVSGCLGREADGTYAPDVGGQARRALEIIRTSLEALGARVEDVIRTRIYVTDVSRWDEVARAHGALFGDVRQACTLVGVTALVDPAALVEIEADALLR
jgi:enamine deaminase RidA (YjgF/YER057c/UK114 family)